MKRATSTTSSTSSTSNRNALLVISAFLLLVFGLAMYGVYSSSSVSKSKSDSTIITAITTLPPSTSSTSSISSTSSTGPSGSEMDNLNQALSQLSIQNVVEGYDESSALFALFENMCTRILGKPPQKCYYAARTKEQKSINLYFMLKPALLKSLRNEKLYDAAALTLLFLKLLDLPIKVQQVVTNRNGQIVFVRLSKAITTGTNTVQVTSSTVNTVSGLEDQTVTPQVESSISSTSSSTSSGTQAVRNITVNEFVREMVDVPDDQIDNVKNGFNDAETRDVVGLIHSKAIKTIRTERVNSSRSDSQNIPIRLFVHSILADLVSVLNITGNNIAPTDCDYVSIFQATSTPSG